MIGFDRFTEDMQVCTRLVTKAYASSGLKLVDNIEMCTPKQLQNSKCVEIHKVFLREASDFDIKFAASYDVTDDMVNSTFKLFDSLKSFDNGKIRTMRQLISYVASHNDDDEAICGLLQDSGYLDVLNIEERRNTYNYNKEEFIDFYGDNAYEAAISALETNKMGIVRHEEDGKGLIRTFFNNGKNSLTMIKLIELNKKIVEQHKRRLVICYAVMQDPRT